jgi:hypothetical protein
VQGNMGHGDEVAQEISSEEDEEEVSPSKDTKM